jgi:SOS-response transcriptional repressor LexA
MEQLQTPLPLTPLQERYWRYLQGCKRSPSYRETAKALGLSSTSEVTRLVLALERKGYVRRAYYKARSIVPTTPTLLSRFSAAELIAELERRAG